MAKTTEVSSATSSENRHKGVHKKTAKRFYWLGHDKPSSQDTFFIEALDKNIWSQGSADNWDTCWYTGMPESETFEQLDAHKTINHIPGNRALTIKSCLNETLTEAKQHAEGSARAERYAFFPQAFSMPEDYLAFQAEAAANPDALWIQKPKNLSRGRGIKVVEHPETVPFEEDWLIQRYLSEPHLYNGHKYVLRFYVLITSIEPLRFYWYKEGFAKLASETYSEDDLSNLYRHLTNPDINEENADADTPVSFFSFTQYRQWLKDNGHDDQALFDEFKDLITLTVIAAREKMRQQCKTKKADLRGCYELIGLDCMVDKQLKPWILECNLSPSLDTYASDDSSANIERVIKRQVVHDLVSLLQLNSTNEGQTKQTLSPVEQAQLELENSGDYEPLFPGAQSEYYLNHFPVPRGQDIASLATKNKEVASSFLNVEKLFTLKPQTNNECVFSDSIALYSHKHGYFLNPDDIAMWIWIKHSEGLSPSAIAKSIQEQSPLPAHTKEDEYYQQLLMQVWDTLSDWGQAGLFDTQEAAKNLDQLQNINRFSGQSFYLNSEKVCRVHVTCPIAAQYLSKILDKVCEEKHNAVSQTTSNQNHYTVYYSPYGYSIANENKILLQHLKLSELLPKIILLSLAEQEPTAPLLQAQTIEYNNHHFLLINENDDIAFTNNLLFSEQFSPNTNCDLISSYSRLASAPQATCALDAPLIRSAKQKGKKGIVANLDQQIFFMEKKLYTAKNKITLQGIIYINKTGNNEKQTKQTIHVLNGADAMAILWSRLINKNSQLIPKLVDWIDSISHIRVYLDSPEQLKKCLDLHIHSDSKTQIPSASVI